MAYTLLWLPDTKRYVNGQYRKGFTISSSYMCNFKQYFTNFFALMQSILLELSGSVYKIQLNGALLSQERGTCIQWALSCPSPKSCLSYPTLETGCITTLQMVWFLKCQCSVLQFCRPSRKLVRWHRPWRSWRRSFIVVMKCYNSGSLTSRSGPRLVWTAKHVLHKHCEDCLGPILNHVLPVNPKRICLFLLM